MSSELGLRLLRQGVLQPAELRRALWDAHTTGKPLIRAIAEASSTAKRLLETPAPGPATVRFVVALDDVLQLLPAGLAWQFLTVPVRRDPRTGTIDMAMVDPSDSHALAELEFHLGRPVRPLGAPLSEVERALMLAGEPRSPRSITANLGSRPADAPGPSSDPRTRPGVSPSRIGTAGPDAEPNRGGLSLVFDEEPDPEDEELEVVPLIRRATRGSGPLPPSPPPALVSSASVALSRPPPFPSLTPILEQIDVASGRDELLDAVARGLSTFAAGVALFASRKGRWVGLTSGGRVDQSRLRTASLPTSGAVAYAMAHGERFGPLDATVDRDLIQALGMDGTHIPAHLEVLIAAALVGDRPALLLGAFGISDAAEATRRSRVLAAAAAAALTRILSDRR